MQSLCILGRQPFLGLAELESLYGANAIHPVHTEAVLLDVDPCVLAFDRLGGSIKFAKVLTILPSTSWGETQKFLLHAAPDQSQHMKPGKMQLGLSAYGFDVTPQKVLAAALSLKKAIQATGRSVRITPNQSTALSSAQVIHNHLSGEQGWELIVARSAERTIIAQTIKVQDIKSYTSRDRERPKRDSRVGMLPPKLAQIIINLAVGPIPLTELTSICEVPAGSSSVAKLDKLVLDPFCGTGVILQEASLMGYQTMGTDIEERMITYTKNNLDWLAGRHSVQPIRMLTKGDATTYQWAQPIDYVASETYLGRPFTSPPRPEELSQTMTACNQIIKKFLQNWHQQSAKKSRLCIAVPAWRLDASHFKHLPLVDQIEQLGYNRISFEHAAVDELVYHRPDQFTARQLLVLERK